MVINKEAGKRAFTRGTRPDNRLAYMGSIGVMLATGVDTGGRFAVVEFTAKPGNEPPPHFHEWEDEFYFILEGEIEFHCGADSFAVRAGEAMFIPQGEAHAMYIRSAIMRTLIFVSSTDGREVGLDRYFVAMGTPAGSVEADAPTHATADPARAVEIAGRFGTVILTPEQTRIALPNYPGFGISQ